MNMGKRTGLASLRRLGVTLAKTLQYGTPLSQALRTLSAEMRQEALNRFEARAGRRRAPQTVPMIVFILPCVFLVVGGPAIIHVLQGKANFRGGVQPCDGSSCWGGLPCLSHAPASTSTRRWEILPDLRVAQRRPLQAGCHRPPSR